MEWFLIVLNGVVFAVVAAAIGGYLYYSHVREKNRTREFAALAESLGLEFLDRNNEVLSNLQSFGLFQQGRARTAWNVLKGGTDDEQLHVFDYRFTTGSGKHQATHMQTVACFQSALLDLPQFDLSPERWYHRVGKAVLGMQDINFDEYPVFSKLYVLRGTESGIRQRFTEPLVRHLETEKNICAAGRGNQFIFFRQGKRVTPSELKEFMRSAYQMYAFAKGESDHGASIAT